MCRTMRSSQACRRERSGARTTSGLALSNHGNGTDARTPTGAAVRVQEPNMIGVAVVGYGYWGPNLVRNLWDAPGARLVSVCDMRTERLAGVQPRYPAVE